MKILNKNSTGSRSRALTEREVMQELTPGDKNYGKISVGTDGTYEGEVLIGKDSDVQNTLANINATHPFNGYVGSKKDMRFETSTNNILKVANMQEQYIVDGKVVGTLGEELVVNGDFSSVLGSEWTTTSAATISIVGGRLRVVTTNLDKGVFQSGVVTRGTTYKVSGYAQGEHISVIGFDGISFTNIQTTNAHFNFYVTMSADSTTLPFRLYLDSSGTAYFDNISVREVSTIDLNTTNDRTGFNGEGDNSFVPHVHVVGFDPISTGTITGNRVATDAQIGTILDNIPAQTANTRIKCRVKPTTDGIKVEILDKSDSDAVVRTQTVDGTDAETLTFTLPVNNDGYKVKATKITNDGVDSDDADERIDVTSEVSTGVIVDGKVKRGDYVVVDKEELVTNGRFDTDSDWGNSADTTLTISDGVATLDGILTSDTTISQPISLNEVEYLATVEFLNGTEGSIYITGIDKTVRTSTGTGTQSIRFIGKSTAIIRLATDKSTSITVDNISVQLADDTFKATEDTNDGDSLASSKFKPADYISNQVFVGMKDDGTYTYDVLMNDAYAKESTTETLTNNGYSSLGKGLFSKGSDVITPIGYWQTLNKGAYHPVLNSFGTAAQVNITQNGWVSWYATTAKVFSDVTCGFLPYQSGGVYGDVGKISLAGNNYNRHPQGKFYDIVYPSQWLDMRYSSTKTNLHDTASKVFSDGVSGKGGVCDTVGMVSKTAANYYNYNNNDKLGISFDGYAQSKFEKYKGTTVTVFTVDGLNIAKGILFPELSAGNYALYNIKIIKGFSTTNSWTDTTNIVIRKDLPITQVGEQLTAKAYCDPSLYPQILKDKLANGQIVIGIEPALINQNGNNIIPAGQTEFSLCNTKARAVHNVIVSTNPEADKPSYSSKTVSADYVENKITQTLNTGDFALVSSTASIPVATIQDPKAVEYVLEKYTATNSHSVYQANNITGLIGVGTGDDIESSYLGNCDIGVAEYVNNGNPSEIVSIISNKTIIFNKAGSTDNTTGGIKGHYYKRVGISFTASLYNASFGISSAWKDLGTFGATNVPEHQTISLSNTGDKASKAFLTIASDDNNELYAQWMVEELASGWDGTSTFEDDTTTGLTIDKVYQEQTSKLLYRALADKITVSDTVTWSNPFDGDSGEFEQLANDTLTDVNGNTIRTVCASTPLNLLKDV